MQINVDKSAVVAGATGYVGSAITKGVIEHGQVGLIKYASRDVQKANWLKDLGTGSNCNVEVVPL